jgi:hypothetical protein
MSEQQWRSRAQTREDVPEMDPASVIKDILDAPSSYISINGWGVYVAKEPLNPHRAITVYNSGGLQPNPKWALDYPSVQVRVRGFPNNYQESRQKAQDCKDVLLGLPPQDVNTGGDRIVSVVIRADIVDLGFDNTNRPIHTINFNLITQPSNPMVGNRQQLPDIG